MVGFLDRAFAGFEDEAAIIGRLVVCYGEVEYKVMRCLAEALGGDNSTAARAFYRVRGEEQRLQIADALTRRPYERAGLGSQYAEAIANAGYCRRIRNQYAHSHWFAGDTHLMFIQWEDAARGNNGKLTMYPITSDLLRLQEEHFVFCLKGLGFLSAEMKRLREPSATHLEKWPRKIARPPLYFAQA